MMRVFLVVGLAMGAGLVSFAAKPPPILPITVEPVSGIGKEAGVCRRDPSDVIRVGDTWYVWYTRLERGAPLYPSGYHASVWYATSTDDAGTVHRNIDLTHAFHCCCNGVYNLLFIAHIGAHITDLAAQFRFCCCTANIIDIE